MSFWLLNWEGNVHDLLGRTVNSKVVMILVFNMLAGLFPLSAMSAEFSHPGIINNKTQLDFIKAKVKAGTQPWKLAFDEMRASSSGSLNYTPKARASVDCGSFSNPDIGCSDEKRDAIAAYTQALLWYFTDNEAYAKNSIKIMNAWSSVLKAHTLSNAPLQSAWVASQFPRAGEIIRYSYPAWPAAEVAQFSNMLKNVYLPLIINGSGSNGNWELSMIDASMAIGVFLDDRIVFDKSVSMWRKRVPAYFYLKSDGALPIPPPSGNHSTPSSLIQYWYAQTQFENGLAQETCRDFGHTQYGLAAVLNVAETAYLQGVDLYGEESQRLVAAMEFHANYLLGTATPKWLCSGSMNVSENPTWEIGYNHYHARLATDMPLSKKLIETRLRPTGVDHHMAWESLTHAELAKVGVETVTISMVKPLRSQGHSKVVFGNAGSFTVLWTSSRSGRSETYSLTGNRLSKP
jgi:hypothetical protein